MLLSENHFLLRAIKDQQHQYLYDNFHLVLTEAPAPDF